MADVRAVTCMEWQPIHTAPEDGTPILATDGKLRCIVAKKPKRWVWVDKNGKNPETRELEEAPNRVSSRPEMETLTHWMPLPELPK